MLGGFFIALGAAPLILCTHAAGMYLMPGFTYLVVIGVRLVSMFVDRSQGERSNWISLIVEVFLGVILVLLSCGEPWMYSRNP